MPQDAPSAESRAGTTPQRILVAHDLLPEADRAVALVAAMPWPPNTVVRIVTSPMDVGETISSFMGPSDARAQSRLVSESISAAHVGAIAQIGRTVERVETAVLTGPPGDAVVAEATTFEADLVVAGARTQSGLARTLLGSISTEISERAPCSILIVRVESFDRILLATDGSEAAGYAEDAVLRWPALGNAAVRVVAVADPSEDHPSLLVSPDAGVRESGGPSASAARAEAAVDRAVAPLAAAGRAVEGQVRSGIAAAEIIAAAREWPADIVVVGSIGHSLVRRLVVGSVAREVLHGVQSSVLLVRPPSG